MTEQFDDFEERLRAALHAEADDVPVSHDALERIRARTERKRLLPWSGLAWLRPVVAVGAAALIAGSVLVGTPQIRERVLPESFVSAADSREAEPAPSPSPQPDDRENDTGVLSGGAPPAPESDSVPTPSDPGASEGSQAPAAVPLSCDPEPSSTPTDDEESDSADDEARECRSESDPKTPQPEPETSSPDEEATTSPTEPETGSSPSTEPEEDATATP